MADAIMGFFGMGGYGAYVWPAYAIAAVIMLALLLASLRQWHRANRQLDRLKRGNRGDNP